MECHKIPYLTLTFPLWFFYADDLYLLQGIGMKQNNLGFLTMKIYTIKTVRNIRLIQPMVITLDGGWIEWWSLFANLNYAKVRDNLIASI